MTWQEAVHTQSPGASSGGPALTGSTRINSPQGPFDSQETLSALPPQTLQMQDHVHWNLTLLLGSSRQPLIFRLSQARVKHTTSLCDHQTAQDRGPPPHGVHLKPPVLRVVFLLLKYRALMLSKEMLLTRLLRSSSSAQVGGGLKTAEDRAVWLPLVTTCCLSLEGGVQGHLFFSEQFQNRKVPFNILLCK